MQSHSRRSQSGGGSSWLSANNWHSLSPERRALKRHKATAASHLNHPDVYPQDPNQEEDKMDTERLKRGYHAVTPIMEYDSIIKNPRLGNVDEMAKTAKWIMQIMLKKNEINVINLDKKRLKECTFQKFDTNTTTKSLQDFFFSFTTGRRELHQLARRFPTFAKREDCMNSLYFYKVPIQRALWFFKMLQFGHHNAGGPPNKPNKRPSVEVYSSDQTKLFSKFIREFFRHGDNSPMLERWPYFSCILKHAFEGGIVDRHDFLMDICDVANDHSAFPLEKPQIFRMLIVFLSHFVDVITQNAMLSRRVAYLIAARFRCYKRDYDRKRGVSSAYSGECFADLVNCQHHRAVMMVMLGLTHAIIIDCPVALLWNPLEGVSHGSPLDMLPCPPDVLSQHLPSASSGRINELLQCRVDEIRRRSRNVERRWMQETDAHFRFDVIVDVCLNVISTLDKAVLNTPNAFLRLYQQVFCAELSEKVTPQMLLRILIQWAVTTEREGTHRALVVCHLLRLRKRHYRSQAFGRLSLQDLLADYLANESPTPASAGANFVEEFRNLIHLFVELQHFRLFSHDAYTRALLRCGHFTYEEPILQKITSYTNVDSTVSELQLQSQPPANGSFSDSFGTPSGTDPAIISFIPTTSSTSMQTNPSAGALPSVSTTSNFRDASAGVSANFSPAGMPTLTPSLSSSSLLGESPAGGGRPMTGAGPATSGVGKKSGSDSASILEHAFITAPADLTVHERFFLHLPLEQTDECRDACNQRAILLYGINNERDAAQQELQKIASQICRIWQKKINVEFFENSTEVRFKRRFSAEQIADCLAKFRTQTYYNQLVIAGWCVRNLIEMITDFLNCYSLILPTSESLEIVCFMLATCQNHRGILTLAVELLSHLILLERFLLSFNNDCIPGTIAGQLAYVIVGHLAENFQYFIHSEEAPTIVNGLYRLVEKELRAEGYPISGWARAIACFVFHAKNELLNAGVASAGQLLGAVDVFRRIFPKSGAERSPQELRHNLRLFVDFLQEPRRFYSYHDYKKHLPSIEDAHTQYSFVVNAFVVAKAAKRDYPRLVELSNICGHVSAERPLAGMWCVAVQELCYSGVTKHGFSHLISEINVNDVTTRYSISTFVLLLASKYSFSCHALFTRLLNNVLTPFIRTDQVNFNGSEMGLCLALEIITAIVCATDVAFNSESVEADSNGGRLPNGTNNSDPSGDSEHARVGSPPTVSKDPLLRAADERALRIVQIRELDACIFPVLSAVCVLTDAVKRKLNASGGTNPNLRRLSEVLKCSFLAMCEQEWVIARVFRICETEDMDAFNCNALKHNSVGQQLLRIALRRRSERLTKQQLMVCNGNSKKSLLDKLLSAMTLWNMRATFYDLKLMIKEVSPDGTQRHAPQQQAYMDALICEIGKCCRDLFLNGQLDRLAQPTPSIRAFRFNQINCYWLIAPLINVCPKPDNVPQSFGGQVTVKAKFLKESALMLDTDTSDDRLKQRMLQQLLSCLSQKFSASLLRQRPFLNLILTCTQGEELDNLIGSLLRYIQIIINKAKENPTLVHQHAFALEREGLLLRLNLIGGVFDSLLAGANISEPWAIALFQLIFYEVISHERERECFDTCYDMLATLVHGMLAVSSPPTQGGGDSERRAESRARFPAYNSFVKKIRKELGDRTIPPDLHCLAQLLPIGRTDIELRAWEAFSASAPQKNAAASKSAVVSQQYLGVRIDKQPQYVQRRLMRLLHHTHYADVPAPGVASECASSAGDVFLAPPAVKSVSVERYMTPYTAPPAEPPTCVDVDASTNEVPVAPQPQPLSQPQSQASDQAQNQSQSQAHPQLQQHPQQHSHQSADFSPTPHLQSMLQSSNSAPNLAPSGRLMPGFPPTSSGLIFGSATAQSTTPPQSQSQPQPQFAPGGMHGAMITSGSSQPQIQSQMSNAASVQEMIMIQESRAAAGLQQAGGPMMKGSGPGFGQPQIPQLPHAMMSAGQPNTVQIDTSGRMFGGPQHPAGLSTMGMPPGPSGMHHSSMAQAAAAATSTGFMSDGASRSGSSTPTMMSDSPKAGMSSRGGRGRKNAAGQAANPTATGQQPRAQKRKKEPKQAPQQTQAQQQPQINPMMTGGLPSGSGMIPMMAGMGGGPPPGPMMDMMGQPTMHMPQMPQQRGAMMGIPPQQLTQQQMLAWQMQQQQMAQRNQKHQMMQEHQQQQLQHHQQQQEMPTGGRFPGDQFMGGRPGGMMPAGNPGGMPSLFAAGPGSGAGPVGPGSGPVAGGPPQHMTPQSSQTKQDLHQKLLQRMNNQQQH